MDLVPRTGSLKGPEYEWFFAECRWTFRSLCVPTSHLMGDVVEWSIQGFPCTYGWSNYADKSRPSTSLLDL